MTKRKLLEKLILPVVVLIMTVVTLLHDQGLVG